MLFDELEMEVVGEMGRLVEAAVEGLMSWEGEGWRFKEADWIVEAMSIAGLDMATIVKQRSGFENVNGDLYVVL